MEEKNNRTEKPTKAGVWVGGLVGAVAGAVFGAVVGAVVVGEAGAVAAYGAWGWAGFGAVIGVWFGVFGWCLSGSVPEESDPTNGTGAST